VSAIFAHRTLKFHDWSITKDVEKLSSGMRINRAGDDASGLAVSEKMRAQINGLRQAERNTEDGMSFIQTAEGYLGQTASIIQRIRVLAVQAANGIYEKNDRQLIQVEVSALVDEVDRIAKQAEFNNSKILIGAYSQKPTAGVNQEKMQFQMGANPNQSKAVFIEAMTASALGFKTDQGNTSRVEVDLTDVEKANKAMEMMDSALQRLNKQRADLGAYYNRLETTAKGLMTAYENLMASESRIRDADMAEEMVDFTKSQILVQTGTSMLGQANLKGHHVLRLLGS